MRSLYHCAVKNVYNSDISISVDDASEHQIPYSIGNTNCHFQFHDSEASCLKTATNNNGSTFQKFQWPQKVLGTLYTNKQYDETDDQTMCEWNLFERYLSTFTRILFQINASFELSIH